MRVPPFLFLGFLLPRCSLTDDLLDLPDGEAVGHRPLRQLQLAPLRLQRQKRPGMPPGKPAVGDRFPHFFGQLQQPQRIRHGGPVLSDGGGNLFLRQPELLLQPLVSFGLLNRVEVFSLEIFNQRQLKRIPVTDLPDQRRGFRLSKKFKGPEASLPGD